MQPTPPELKRLTVLLRYAYQQIVLNYGVGGNDIRSRVKEVNCFLLAFRYLYLYRSVHSVQGLLGAFNIPNLPGSDLGKGGQQSVFV